MWGRGLPLHWRIGGQTASERHHAAEMMDELPANATLIDDARMSVIRCSGPLFH
jgi:hypothetical protein